MCFDKTAMDRWTLIILQKHVWFSMSKFLSNMHVIFQEMWPHKNCVIIESFFCACRLLITESNNLSGYFSKVQISMVVVKVLQFNRLIFFFLAKTPWSWICTQYQVFIRGQGLLALNTRQKYKWMHEKFLCVFFSSRLWENVNLRGRSQTTFSRRGR